MYLNTRPRDSAISLKRCCPCKIEQSNEKINVSLTFLPWCILFCTSLLFCACVCVCVCRTLTPPTTPKIMYLNTRPRDSAISLERIFRTRLNKVTKNWMYL